MKSPNAPSGSEQVRQPTLENNKSGVGETSILKTTNQD